MHETLEAMIEIKQIRKSFGKVKALDEVNLQCETGHCIALIGPNGCGKTTMIKSILGMITPDSGQILFEGKPISGEYKYRSKIGYMPQIGRYPDQLTVAQVIRILKQIRHDEKQDLDMDLIKSYRLEGMMDKRINTLSGGTRQKVSAALAFLFNPKVLILDEPTAGLDPISSEILATKINQEKKNGKLILITSHILSELDDLVSQVIYMQEGRIIFHKNLADLQKETSETKLSKVIARIMEQN